MEYLASEQWDALLEVAKQWAKIDRRRELETSDEEEEEQFIDEGRETSATRSVVPRVLPLNDLTLGLQVGVLEAGA